MENQSSVLESDHLGLIVDEKLSWLPYIKHLTTKILSAVMAMKQVSFYLAGLC